MSISQAIRNRKSCRAYLDQEVHQETVQKIIETARWAPSGVNHQPAQVAVLGREIKSRLSRILVEKHSSGIPPNPDYAYCPKDWPPPLNAALALILQKKNGLGNEKTRQNLFEENLSGGLPMTGLEPAPCCQE